MCSLRDGQENQDVISVDDRSGFRRKEAWERVHYEGEEVGAQDATLWRSCCWEDLQLLPIHFEHV